MTNPQTDAGFELSLLQENPADTHLNICAVLSVIGRHEIAYLHALKALTFLQSEILERSSGNFKEYEYTLRPFNGRCAVLCIAYHNLAAELEFMKQPEDALDAYKKAEKFAEKYLSATNSLTKNLKETVRNLQETINKEQRKKHEREVKSTYKTIRTRSMIPNASQP